MVCQPKTEPKKAVAFAVSSTASSYQLISPAMVIVLSVDVDDPRTTGEGRTRQRLPRSFEEFEGALELALYTQCPLSWGVLCKRGRAGADLGQMVRARWRQADSGKVRVPPVRFLVSRMAGAPGTK